MESMIFLRFKILTFSFKFQAHTGSVWRVTWAHPDFGQVIATCSFDRAAGIWEELRESLIFVSVDFYFYFSVVALGVTLGIKNFQTFMKCHLKIFTMNLKILIYLTFLFE